MNQQITPEHAFYDLLRSESAQTERLLDLLHQEHELLQRSAPEALEELTANKQSQLQELEATVERQNRFLTQLGHSADRQGAEAFIATLPDSSPVRDAWQNLQQMLEASRKQNQINGGIVILNRRQVSHALDLLQGANQDHKTYGRSGESSSARRSNSFGKA